MGLPLLLSIWLVVIAAHLTVFGGLCVWIQQSSIPSDFIEKVVVESVHRVLKESFDNDTQQELLQVTDSKYPHSYWLPVVGLLVAGITLVRIWVCCSYHRSPRGALEDSPRSPSPEIGVVARQQLAEIRLRRHAHRQVSFA